MQPYGDQHTYDVARFFADHMAVDELTMRKVDRTLCVSPRHDDDPVAEAVIVMLAISRLQELDTPTLTGEVWDNLQKAREECARILATLGIVFPDGTPEYTVNDAKRDATN